MLSMQSAAWMGTAVSTMWVIYHPHEWFASSP